MTRWLFLLALLPQCTGCLAYAYPTVVSTPEVTVENRDGSVHAFRVDIDKTERKPATSLNRVAAENTTSSEYTLMRIPLDSRGVVPSQLEIDKAVGVWNPLGVGDFKEREHSSFTMIVRLYRPGYKTMEVKAWEKSRQVDWTATRSLQEQEQAVDDLLADPAAPSNLPDLNTSRGPLPRATWWDLKEKKTPPLGLKPGDTSRSHREALVFAASEYDRLSRMPMANTPDMAAVRDRLRAKATWLRAFAETVR